MKKKLARAVILSSLALFITSKANGSELDCLSKKSKHIEIKVQTKRAIRVNVPKEIFGFNVPWYAFQIGLQKSGEPKPELIKLMKPFDGALYRYPGGSPSNYFDWENSVRPQSKRTLTHYEYEQYYIPEFGYDEFIKFVNKVNGRAIVTLNIVGPYHDMKSSEEVGNNAINFINWLRYKSSARCIGTLGCPVQYLELGNELDWSDYSWSGLSYADRANSVIQSVGNRVPAKVWIANGKTAPWGGFAQDSTLENFNNIIARELPKDVQNISFHPYYDGISIPEVSHYLDLLHSAWQIDRKVSSIIITEHARWPSQPRTGKWSENWYEGTGQGGAISTADFILSTLSDKRVGGASWHALGVLGPWQLIRWNRKKNELYPSPVYWGLLTLREGFLVDAVEINPDKLKSNQYVGGYELRLSAMRGGGRFSVLGANRSNQAIKLIVNWDDGVTLNKAAHMKYTTYNSTSFNDDNDDDYPDKIVMLSKNLDGIDSDYKSYICIPPKSVFSVVY